MALGKMDTILKGILDSTHTESMKHELFRTIAEKGNQRHPTNVIKAVLNLTSEWVLNSPTDFIRKSGFQIYSAWSRSHVSVVEDFFNTEFLVSLLGLNINNPSNAVSLMHESIRILIRTPSAAKLLKIAEAKSINFIRDHADIETIKNYTVFLTDFKECIPKGDFTGSLCQAIIMGMSKFRTPDDMDRLQAYINDVNGIAKFLFFIWNHTDSSAVFQSLKAIFGIIISSDNPNEEPSVCLSSVIHYVPLDMIDIVTKNLVDDPNISDTKMTLALSNMIYWLCWPTSRNIDQWVMVLLKTLGAYHRYSILVTVTETKVEQLFENLRYQPVRDASMNVLSHMLLSFQHSPHAFHKILPLVAETMRIMRDERSPSSSQCLNRVAELFHCLMHHYAGYPELYDPLFECIKEYPKPTPELIQLRLAQSKWGIQKREGLMYISPLLQKSETGRVGLVNLGNSCYMNVVLQALYMCSKFRQALFTLPAHPSLLSTKLQQVFAFLSLSQRGAYAPVKFLQDSRPTWFTQGSQQDCTEYLRYLLEQIHENAVQCRALTNGHETTDDHVTSDDHVVSDVTSDSPVTVEGQESSDNHMTTDGHTNISSSNKIQTSDYVSDVNNSSETVTGAEAAKTNIELDADEVTKNFDIDNEIVENSTGSSAGNDVKDNSDGENSHVPSFVDDIFGGKVINEIKCLSCGHTLNKIEAFTELYLSFPLTGLQFQKNGFDRQNSSNDMRHETETARRREELPQSTVNSSESSRSIHLNMLIKNYLQTEKLKDYQCDVCRERSEAERTVRVIKSPEYLVISLLRFSYDNTRQTWSKILRDVTYPKTLFLPLSDDIENKQKSRSDSDKKNRKQSDIAQPYGLNSVVIHSGTSADSGHYYTYSRPPVMLSPRLVEREIHEQRHGSGDDLDFFQDRWLLFNDSRVSSANYKTFSTVSRRFNKDTVYMLVYRRISDKELKKKKSGSSPEATPVSEEPVVPQQLREEIARDNTQFLTSQEREARTEQLKQQQKAWQGAYYQHDNDNDGSGGPPPPPSCGGGGFGGLGQGGQFVY